MERGVKRLVVLAGVAAVALLALAWWWGGGGDPAPDMAGLSPAEARIQQMRRASDLKGLVREARASDEPTAILAIDAIGYLGAGAVTHIQPLLTDRRSLVREAAAMAMARAATAKDAAPLARLADADPDAKVRSTALLALTKLRAHLHMNTMIEALEDPDRTVRKRAHEAIHKLTGMSFAFDAGAPERDRRQVVRRIQAMREALKATAALAEQRRATDGQR